MLRRVFVVAPTLHQAELAAAEKVAGEWVWVGHPRLIAGMLGRVLRSGVKARDLPDVGLVTYENGAFYWRVVSGENWLLGRMSTTRLGWNRTPIAPR